MGKKKGRKDRPLGGLADALLKAGVVDESAASKADRERRRQERALGPEGRARREEERQEAFAGRLRVEAETSRERERERRAADEEERPGRLVRDHLESGGGNRRWFFVARDGRIPFVEVADNVERMLAQGQAGIVESLGAVSQEHVVISGPQALAALERMDPELVRFWNGGGRRS